MDGLDHRLASGGGHLRAYVPDVAVDGAVRDMDVAGIGGVEDQLAREHESRPRQQRSQDVEFERRQGNRRTQEGCRARVRIDREPWFMALVAAGAGAFRTRRRIALTLATSSRGLKGLVT